MSGTDFEDFARDNERPPIQPWQIECQSCGHRQETVDLRDGCCVECDAPLRVR